MQQAKAKYVYEQEHERKGNKMEEKLKTIPNTPHRVMLSMHHTLLPALQTNERSRMFGQSPDYRQTQKAATEYQGPHPANAMRPEGLRTGHRPAKSGHMEWKFAAWLIDKISSTVQTTEYTRRPWGIITFH